MGVSTDALIKPNTTEIEIVNYLNTKYEDVKCYVVLNRRMGYSAGYIEFKDGDDLRSLYYMSTSLDVDKVDDLNLTKSTYISLIHWGNSVYILKDLCNYFGGAIDENDCDDNGYYWVNKEKYFEDEKLTFIKEVEINIGSQNTDVLIRMMGKYNIKY